MKKTSRQILPFIFLLFALLQSCTSVPPYDVTIKNTGTSNFSHSTVKFKDKVISGGWVIPGQSATHFSPGSPIPDKALVSWKRENGEIHKAEVEVKNKLPERKPDQYYSLIFKIGKNEKVTLQTVLCTKKTPCPERFGD